MLPAAAATDPYVAGSTGYDVSYPNCSATPTGAFAIIGVNHGRPFTANGCFGTEYGGAPDSPAPSAYMNTGYSGAYRKDITAACSGGGTVAWQIGCSEADYSLRQTAGLAESMWWLDVETANSWSSNVSLNRQAIQGAVDRLDQTALPVGIYSTSSMWKTITGGNGYTPSGVAADWIAAGTCTTAFTKSPVWLTQTTSGGIDHDTAC